MGLDVEYTDFACQGDDLLPGQSRTFIFDDWTPDHLENSRESAWEVPYLAEAKIWGDGERIDDMDPGNDIVVNDFELDYWHDPALKEVTSPSGGRGDLLWDNGEPDGRNGLAGSYYYGYSNILIDDFSNEKDWYVEDGHFSFVWNSGTGTGNLDTVNVFFFEDEGDCDPSQDEYYEFEVESFTEETTGEYYFGRPEIYVSVDFPEKHIPPGNWYVGFQPDSISEDLGYMLTAESQGCELMADLPYFGYPRWSSSSYLWGQEYDLAWKLTGYSKGPPGVNVYIKPGTEQISAMAINNGVWAEEDLTCHAEIWEYISDPDNGTKLYEDDEVDIDLMVPLGGEEPLDFAPFTFAEEGRYGLYLDLTLPARAADDFPDNNKIRFGVGVDDTRPTSEHTLDPPIPDGLEGWYVSDLEVSLEAEDPMSTDVSSGVKEIKYQVDGGPVQTITGSAGSFLLTQDDDGDDVLVEYWAVDKVGNEESPHNQFTVDMDQTDPTVDLVYEVTGGSPSEGWEITFTATAEDETSGMDRVVFYLNGLEQETVVGSGPIYVWVIWYHILPNVIFESEAFDIAGNSAIDAVENPDFIENNEYQSQQQQTVKKIIL
jgi:hypothetical protein